MYYAFTPHRLAVLLLCLAGTVLSQCTMPPAPPEPAGTPPAADVAPAAGEVARTETSAEPVPGVPAGAERAHVVRIVDGGTIDVDLEGTEYRVRYILTDPPQPDEPLYNEAAKLNQLILGNRPVFLLQDVSNQDDQGRLLRYVYTESGVLVNAEIVRQGMAKVILSPTDTRFQHQMEEAEQEAVQKGIGLWH